MKRNNSLDGIRGLAALCVAIGHSATHYGGISVWGLTAGDLIGAPAATVAGRLWYTVFQADAAVIVFFVLSGYVLSRALESRGEPPLRAVLPYVVRRIFRLFPVSIAAALVLSAVVPLRPAIVAGHMFLIDNSVNGPIWSLQVELIGCLFVFLLWSLGSNIVALLSIALAVAFSFVHPMWQVMFLPMFALGYLIPSVPAQIWRHRSLMVVSFALLVLADLFLGKEGMYVRLAEGLGAFGFVGSITQQRVGFLLSKPVQFLGAISYPFYLTGIAALIWAGPIADSLVRGQNLIVQASTIALISIPFEIVVAWLIHRFIEMPAIRDGNALLRAIQARRSIASESIKEAG